MRLLLTRPQLENDRLAQQLFNLGHETLSEPLLSIVMHPKKVISDKPYQALIVTSVNGARALALRGAAPQYSLLPVYAVGEATGHALAEFGFNVVGLSVTGVAELHETIVAQVLRDKGPLLYVRGRHAAGDLSDKLSVDGYDVEEVILYEAEGREVFSHLVVESFQKRLFDGVVLFSPRTAQIFSKLVQDAHLVDVMSGVTAYCLSQNVADACVLGGVSTDIRRVIAKLPTQESLVASI